MGRRSRESLLDILTNQFGEQADSLTNKTYAELNALCKAHTDAIESLKNMEETLTTNADLAQDHIAPIELTDETGSVDDNTEQPVSTNVPQITDIPVDILNMEEQLSADVPPRHSVEWPKFLLSQLEDDEKEDGHPKYEGLRRLAELYLDIRNIRTDVVQCPSRDNNYRATCTAYIEIGPDHRQFTGSADCYSGNCEGEYARHAVAVAETRAKGRALREALRLPLHTAEEMLKPETADVLASPVALDQLNTLAQKVGVSLEKVLAWMLIDVNTVDELEPKQVTTVAKQISAWYNKTEEVPEIVKITYNA